MEEEERSGYQRGCGARIFFFFNTKTSFLKGLSGIGRGEGEAGAGGGGSLRRQVVVAFRPFQDHGSTTYVSWNLGRLQDDRLAGT